MIGYILRKVVRKGIFHKEAFKKTSEVVRKNISGRENKSKSPAVEVDLECARNSKTKAE